MEELPPPDSGGVKEGRRRGIKSPSQMARALRFNQDPETAHSRDRDYWRNRLEDGPYPAREILRSADFSPDEGEFEEVYLGVRLEEPLQNWTKENSITSEVFLDWFIEKGGDSQLADAVRQLKASTPKSQRNKVSKKIMREKGYSLMVQVIGQAEELGYFEYLREELSREFEEKKTTAQKAAAVFLAPFPQYSRFINRFGEEKGVFYAAESEVKKRRVAAMWIKVNPFLDLENTGKIEFQLGTMEIDEKGNLSDFRQKDPPKLRSTGAYPQKYFIGELWSIINHAIEVRKAIQDELGL